MIAFEVGALMPMTRQGEVTWQCIAADENGALLVDPTLTTGRAVKALSPETDPASFGEALGATTEGQVYAGRHQVLKVFSQPDAAFGIQGDRLPHLQVGVALHYGLFREKPVFNRWQVAAPKLIGAFVSTQAIERPGHRAEYGRVLMERVPNLPYMGEHSPVRRGTLLHLMDSIGDQYSRYPIGLDGNEDNRLISRFPGVFRPGILNLIDCYAIPDV